MPTIKTLKIEQKYLHIKPHRRGEIHNCGYKGEYHFCPEVPAYIFVDFDTLMCVPTIPIMGSYKAVWRYFPEYLELLKYASNKINLDEQYFYVKIEVPDEEVESIAEPFLRENKADMTDEDIRQWWLYNWYKHVKQSQYVHGEDLDNIFNKFLILIKR